MTDYELTGSQQTKLVNFLNDGKSLFVDGNDFGYYHETDPIYQMFGCTYLGDHKLMTSLTRQNDTLVDGSSIDYAAGGYTDDYMDWIGPNGGDMLFKCQANSFRAVAYSGPNGSYRALHCAFWFGALKNAGATYTKTEIMASFMRYLKGDTLVCDVGDEISCAAGGDTNLMLELTPAAAGAKYLIAASMSGTTPGTMINGVNIPLNQDNFTQFVLDNLNAPMFGSFANRLDASGRAIGVLDSLGPIDPVWIGKTIYFAGVQYDPVTWASNATAVDLVP